VPEVAALAAASRCRSLRRGWFALAAAGWASRSSYSGHMMKGRRRGRSWCLWLQVAIIAVVTAHKKALQCNINCSTAFKQAKSEVHKAKSLQTYQKL
jgi:dihydroxyacid dehydratase/phosphogluconate dehydratase